MKVAYFSCNLGQANFWREWWIRLKMKVSESVFLACLGNVDGKLWKQQR